MERHVGRSMIRLEDERFLTGHGRFTADVVEASELHLHVLRSPHAHAAIGLIDTAAAWAATGVHGVFTAADLAADGIGPLPCMAVIDAVDPLVRPPRHALATGRVRHVGDPVACVVAETAEAARDAAELIAVSYEPLPAVVDAAAALAGGAPQIWEEAAGNLAFRFQKGDRAATSAAFTAAAHVAEIELVNNRVVVAPIEPRAAIGRYDAASLTFHLLLTGQGVHAIRRQLAEHIFGVPHGRVQVRAPDVGGGFGTKNFVYPEWVMVLWAARRLLRPVKWIGERSEEFVSSTQGRAARTRARLALDGAGRFLGLEVSTIADMGAYLSGFGPHSSTNASAAAMGGCYAIPAIFLQVRGAFTNTVPIDAYRGAGKPEANYLIERLVDVAADQLGRDPAALRRANMIARFPYRAALGSTIDCGRFAANLDDVLAAADRAGFAQRRDQARRRGRLRGLGIACFLETARGQPNEEAEIRFAPDGQVTLVVGTQSNGQGHETSYPQIAADLLGLPPQAFRYIQADTEAVRNGAGHGGARSMHLGGGALVKAAEGVIAKGRAIAARLLQADADTVVFEDGKLKVADTGRSIDLIALARAATDPGNFPEGIAPGLGTHAVNQCDLITFPNGCHIAEVEIDPETGAVSIERYTVVDDFGRLINPLLTAGQVMGGIAQGIGQAMLEHTVYDENSGQPLSGSFMDYALPRADDLPSFEVTLRGVATSANPLGVKGCGQAGAIAAPPTIINAIVDALSVLGIRHLDMPATQERIWRAIRAARAAGATSDLPDIQPPGARNRRSRA
jgi:carbon-monoxide dehydrogenase large subunit